MSFDGLVKPLRRFVENHTSAILTGLNIAGTVGTVVLAVRATPQAIRDIQDAESEFTEVTNLDKVKLVWRGYIPAALLGAATITAAIGAQSVSQRRQAALMSIIAVGEKSFNEFREKTREIVGEQKEIEIMDEVAKEHLASVPMVNSEVIITGAGDHLCFDTLTSRYFRSDINKIKAAVNEINAMCLTDTYASQNDFYRLIGLPPAVFGEEQGWRFDNLMDVHFTSVLNEENGSPALALEYRTSPIRGYHKINP